MMRCMPVRRERGISVFVVLVMVLLTTLLVLWASRSALLNELITGNDSDYQRALEAAHAMLRDAELDIQGIRADGSPCSADVDANCRHWGSLDAASGHVYFPESEDELLDVLAVLSAQSPPCIAGVCAPITTTTTPSDPAAPTTQFWTEPARLGAMQGRAAHYGDHTGAKAGDVGNPLLVTTDTTPHAWYWVELLPYDSTSAFTNASARKYEPDATNPYIFRITAVATGLRPGTQAVVQSTFVWRRSSS